MATNSRAGSPFTNENQLILFSDVSEAELADKFGKDLVHDLKWKRAHTSRPPDPGALENHCPKMVESLERGNHFSERSPRHRN